MPLSTKTMWFVASVIMLLLLPACGSSARAMETGVIPTATPGQQTLKTSMGEFAIVSARLVDEVHDSKAPEGEQFLLIGLAQPNLQKLVPGEFSLEKFQETMLKSQNEIYILGNDGSQTFYTSMGGWVEDDFVIGFRVPAGGTYTLYWTDNAPISLQIEK